MPASVATSVRSHSVFLFVISMATFSVRPLINKDNGKRSELTVCKIFLFFIRFHRIFRFTSLASSNVASHVYSYAVNSLFQTRFLINDVIGH